MYVVTIEYADGSGLKTTAHTWAEVTDLLKDLRWYRVAIVHRERI